MHPPPPPPGSQTVRKVVPLAPHLLGTIAGGAADCQYWERELQRQCRLYAMTAKRPISVAAASQILHNIIYSYKGNDLSMGIMVSGVDESGPHVYYLSDEGVRTSGHLFSVGSGSTNAYAILQTGYRYDMEKAEALELGRRAIYHATHRDAYSGGIINGVEHGAWMKHARDEEIERCVRAGKERKQTKREISNFIFLFDYFYLIHTNKHTHSYAHTRTHTR